MQPFNLDRFKAGEPAYDKDDNTEYFFLADFPDDRISVKYFDNENGWHCFSSSIAGMGKGQYYMKEKELTWDEVSKMWPSEDHPNFYGWLDANFEAPKRKNK